MCHFWQMYLLPLRRSPLRMGRSNSCPYVLSYAMHIYSAYFTELRWSPSAFNEVLGLLDRCLLKTVGFEHTLTLDSGIPLFLSSKRVNQKWQHKDISLLRYYALPSVKLFVDVEKKRKVHVSYPWVRQILSPSKPVSAGNLEMLLCNSASWYARYTRNLNTWKVQDSYGINLPWGSSVQVHDSLHIEV